MESEVYISQRYRIQDRNERVEGVWSVIISVSDIKYKTDTRVIYQLYVIQERKKSRSSQECNISVSNISDIEYKETGVDGVWV